MTIRSLLFCILLTLPTGWLFFARDARAAEPTAADFEFFEKNIRPVLAAHCYECHGPKKQEAGLRLDSRMGLLRGGDTGASIVPGKPGESLLIEAVLYGDDGYQMPPSGKLTKTIINNLTRWVKMGAPWPKEVPPKEVVGEEFDLQERAKHWSFQPIQTVSPPIVRDDQWPRTAVDRFILAKLEAKNLQPAPDVSRRALLRRLHFALTGLPPTPEEVNDFLNNDSPRALQEVVDRLLGSPHFGERWGRHWLDLVRYSETHGHEFDYPIHHAWRYRDYVIRALNADLPYRDFVREHIAGDLLTHPRRHPIHGFNESIIGTGFWFLGEATHSPVDVRGDEAGRIDNQIDVMTKTFLGVTVACARCHDHKFDPLTTKDYYALAGYLQSSRRQEALLDPHGKIADLAKQLRVLRAAGSEAYEELLPQPTTANANRFQSYLTATEEIKEDQPHDSEGNETKQRGLEPDRLKKWNAALAHKEVDQPSHPLFAWKSLLTRLAEGEKSVEELRQDIVKELNDAAKSYDQFIAATTKFADFNDDDYGDWFVTGHAFGDAPTQAARFDATTTPATPALAGVAHSGQLAGKLQGVLRSPTFEITGNRIFYRMAGRGGKIRLIIDGYNMLEFSQLLFGGIKFPVDTDGAFVWHAQDVGKYSEHKAYIELIDHGDGFVAVDEIRFGDHQAKPLDPPDEEILKLWQDERHTTRESLAAAYSQRWNFALKRWHDGECDPADSRLLAWVGQNALFPLSNNEAATFEQLRARMQELAKTIPAPIHTLAIAAGTPEDERVHIRGSHVKLGDLVPRRFLEVIGGPDQPPIPDACGRLELAEQIVDPDNPLTARVIVNRVWHHLFGRGIVASVDNFGILGQQPTHPQLLDYLAREFMQDGWSLKRLIRRLVLSRTYQMSSKPSDDVAEETDPANQLLHRMRIQRLEGEVIRDAILAISGRLDREQFGASIPIHLTSFMEGRGRPKKNGPLDGAGRRSIYISVNRNFLSPMMLAFDTPIPFSTVGRRTESNVPAQALILMNDPFVKQQAQLWAKRLLEVQQDTHQRITTMYASAYARQPTPEELEAAIGFLHSQAQSYKISDHQIADDPRVWADLCHVLFTLKEFTFVE